MEHHRFVVAEPGSRLDDYLARQLHGLSRSRVQHLIEEGFVAVCGGRPKTGQRLKKGQVVEVRVPEPRPAALIPEPLALEVVFEDEVIVVVNKPPGLVVHPAPGHATGTLVQGLLHRCPDLEGVGGFKRPGLVHRLDKDTSGLMVIAKTDQAHHALSRAFKTRRVGKTYLAVLLGRPPWREKEIEAPIGRHPVRRKKMAVIPGGREAKSRFKVMRELSGPLSLVEVALLTGRTHQIRVHAAHLGHPVLGDPLYGSRSREKNLVGPAKAWASRIKRQMLHAFRLSFDHPLSGDRLSFEGEMPSEMVRLVDELEKRS